MKAPRLTIIHWFTIFYALGIMLARTGISHAQELPRVKFAPPFPYGPADVPDVVVNDLNGDGKMDFACVSRFPNLMTVFTNSGTTSFGFSTNYLMPGPPTSITAGDLNGDGKPDLVATSAGIISVFTNVINATFAPPINYGIFTNGALTLSSVSLGDFNGDHKLDIAAGISGSNVVTVLLNNGDGTFGLPKIFSTGSTASLSPITITLADVNNDGIPDIVTANGSGGESTSVLLGNGDGSFGTGATFSARGWPISAVVADFNNDGKPDIATANANENSVGLLFGKGDGTFQTAVTNQVLADPRPMAAADLNGDGNPDLVMVHNSNRAAALGILLGKGDGAFLAETNAFAPTPVNRIIVADVNGDNQPDLVIAANSGVSFFLNQSLPALKYHLEGDHIILQWPNWSGYTLETTFTTLPTNNWIEVTDTPTQISNQNFLTNSIDASNQLFRLKHP
jgi:FG-GAP-like repeat